MLSLGSPASPPAAAVPPVEKPVEPETPAPAVKPREPAVVEQPVPVASTPASVAATNGEATNNASPSETINPAGPAVRRLARELGVDLARVSGSGPSGRIIREDVVASVRRSGGQSGSSAQAVRPGGDQDDWGPIHREQMSRMRKTIATNMVRSMATIPHLTNFDDADVTELERLRKDSAAEYAKTNVKLTALAFVVKAVSLSTASASGSEFVC